MSWNIVAVIVAIASAVLTGTVFGVRISMALGAILQELKEMRQDQLDLKVGHNNTIQKVSSVESRVSRLEGRISNGGKYAAEPY